MTNLEEEDEKMKIMKRLVLAFALIMMLAMTGCGSNKGKEEAAEDVVSEATEEGEQDPDAVGEATEEVEEAGEETGAADGSLDYILDKGIFVLGLDDSFPPMGFVNEDQETIGFDIDVAKEVASRLGVELVLQSISWDAKEQELATKNIDCIWNGFTKSEERAKNLTLSNPYMLNTQVAVVLKDSDIASLDDLAGKVVVIQNGSTASDAIDANEEFKNSLGELILVDDNVQALLDLQIGGSDAVVLDEVVARYYTELNEGVYTVLDSTLSEEEYVIGFRKGEEALCNAINEALSEMAADGTLEKISNEWFGENITTIE